MRRAAPACGTAPTARASMLLTALLLLAHPGLCAPAAGEAGGSGDIAVAVSFDPVAESGRASGSVRIHAPRSAVWAVLTRCAEAFNLVPGLADCKVLKSAPDGSWQLIRHVIDYSWYVPKISFEFRADYRYPARISIERVSGDLKVLKATWDLEADGEFTVARCTLYLEPGFWVPRWLVKAALRHDVPRMLRALRAAAESRGGPAAAGPD